MKICKRIKATVLALCLVIGMCAVSFPQTVHAEYGDICVYEAAAV